MILDSSYIVGQSMIDRPMSFMMFSPKMIYSNYDVYIYVYCTVDYSCLYGLEL